MTGASRAGGRDWGAAADVPSGPRHFVWCVWALLLLAALLFVTRFGSNVPFYDEWAMVPALAGKQPVTPGWLWASHNGHRLPLPRLVLLALYGTSGTDFRSGVYFNVLALGALAAVTLWTSQRIRGRASFADAVFPLLLLHWGHCENLLWTWQATTVIPVAILGALMAVMLRYGVAAPFGLAVTAGAGIVMLPLCGGPGLVYVPALALWLAGVGAFHLGSTERPSRLRALIVWTWVGAAMLLATLYFYNYPAPPGLSWSHPGVALVTATKFLASGLGLAAQSLWPASGLAVVALLLFTSGALVRTALRERTPRRALSALLFLAGGVCLATSIGLGRSGAGFRPTYSLQAVPVLCASFLAWGICLPPAAGHAAQMGLLVAVLALSAPNFSAGLELGRVHHDRMESFRSDLLAGDPPARLLARHVNTLCPCPFTNLPTWGVVMDSGKPVDVAPDFEVVSCTFAQGLIGDLLRMLHTAGIGDFRRLRDQDPAVRDVRLSEVALTARRADAVTWPRPKTPEEATLILTLREPLYVCGFRVNRPGGEPANRSGGQPPVQVFWRVRGQTTFRVPQRFIIRWGPGQKSETAWLFETIDQIAIHFGQTEVQRRLESAEENLRLLVPADPTRP